MIERSTALAFCEPQEAQRAMGVIAARIKRARAGKGLDGLSRLTQRLQGSGAIEMRGGVMGLGGDGRIKACDGGVKVVLSSGYGTQVMHDAGVPGGDPKGSTIARLRFAEPACSVMRRRVSDKTGEITVRKNCHGNHYPGGQKNWCT
jgi:hypothetical protein